MAERHGWTRFVSLQNHYNLIYREDERELLPLCVEEKIALTPYSPLASGRLARETAESSRRLETDPVARQKYDAMAASDQRVIDRLAEVAGKHGVPRAHVALAWMLQKSPRGGADYWGNENFPFGKCGGCTHGSIILEEMA